METIQKMYEHLCWANHCILEALKKLENGNQEIIRLFSHILYAEKVWMNRIQGVDSSHLPIWSDTTIEVCEGLVNQNKEDFTTLFTNFTETDLIKIISYKNSTNREFKNTVREILTHVALHGQYHRGQINARLRLNAAEPVNVDFITFVR